MIYAILVLTILLAAVQIFLIAVTLKRMKSVQSCLKADELEKTVREESRNLQSALKDDLVRMISQIKEELYLQQKQQRETLEGSFREFRETFDKNNELTNKVITAKFESLEKFQNERLADIMRTLSRWYDVQIVFESEELKNLVFSGNLDKYDTIESFFKLFEASSDVRFETLGNSIYVRKKR